MNDLRTPLLLLSFGALALSAACASDKSAERPQPGASEQAMEGGGHSCPMAMKDTRIESQPVENGAALAFTTDDPARIEALRERVEQMASMMSQRMASGTGGAGMCPCPKCEEHQGASLPREDISAVHAEEIEGGARLVFTASSPDRVEALRSAIGDRAEQMKSCPCPMMMSGEG